MLTMLLYQLIEIEKHVPIAQARAKFFSSTTELTRRELVFYWVALSNLLRVTKLQSIKSPGMLNWLSQVLENRKEAVEASASY